ncbi:MAG: surface protein, partial [Flavipsychrobacter sp.]|nr:surface protein [Flavipsychrobacter sp.]
ADTIRVDTLVPGLSINPNPACQNNSVAFADSSYSFSSASTAWLWQFGNGATSTLKSPAYTYTTSATYTVTLSVTNGTGCKGKVTRSLKITPPPGIVMGALALCAGQTTTLSNATGGGKWTSGNSTIATIDSVTGVVNAVGAGNVSIQYKLSSGCFAAATLTVNPMPDTILAGTHKVCETYTYTLSDRTSGGTWTSSNTAAATINPSTGVIKGIAANTTIITYQLGTGCYAATTVTIDRTPAVPVGPTSVCVGTTIVLSDLDAGGTWSSGDVSLATIGSATGVVTGVVSGSVDTSVVIVYTLPSGCPSSVIIKVNPALPPITGPRNVCVGSTTTLSDASLGGTWSSANTTIASVLFGVGTVKGVSQGTTTITYTSVKGCTISTTVTVDTLPPPISGIKDVCAGSTTLLSDASPAGTWSTSATIVTVGSSTGIVTGIKAGTAAITYTIATGCKIPATVTVNPLPAGIGITTFSPACAGGNPITILDVTAGGVWSSGNTTILTVVSTGSASADLKGVSAGTAVVTYMLSTGCFTSRTFTVVSLQPPVTSTPEFCAGNTITLTDTGGGTWSSANTIVATVGISSGIVNGLSSGTATITYLIASSGCRATIVVTVDPVPPNIAAVSRICVNDSAFFSDAMPGGAWSSSAIAIATVNTAGIVKGLAAGTATITYMMTTGCFKTASVSINPLPGAIKGKPDLCADTWTQLSDAIGGGWQWTSGNTVVARIDPMSGIVFGNNPGTATITYTLSTGCATTAVVTVNPVPAAVTGTVYVCLGDTAVLSDITTGGTWSSSSPGIAFVPSDTGVVSSISAGTATVTYTLATGCLAVTSFTVYPLPSAITGSTRICLGAANILSDLIPGTWSSSDVSIASVDGSGAVTGMALGTADITFTSAGNCKAMTTVTVYPVLAPLVGDTIVCIGVKATLSEAVPGGVWSSTDTNIAVIDTAGVLTGRATGTTIISYTLANSCDTAAMELFVFPQPYADTIKGSDHVCTRASIQLSNSVKGGVWTSSNNLLAMVDTAGIVTGVAQGMDTIYYTYTNRCGTDMTSKAILISQAATSAQIIIHPDTSLCSNIMFMNFGADSPEPPGGHYVWSADNAVVYAVSADKQNCLITFPWPGISIVRLTSQFLTSDCASEEGLTFHISNEESPVPQVVYYEPELVCMDHTADSYQWGYDDVKTLDSVIINGAVNQNYYEPKLEVTKKNYWVLTYHDGCLQKSYYNTPTGVVPGPGDDLDIKLYPNPADASVNMEVSGMRKSDRIGFKLYDILGKERSIGILEAGKGSIQLADSPAGVYMVLFTKNGVKIGTRVFVKK